MNEPIFTFSLIILEVIFSGILLTTLLRAGLSKAIARVCAFIFALWLIAIYLVLSREGFSVMGVQQVSFTLAIVIPVALGYVVSVNNQSLRQAISRFSINEFLFLQYWRSVFGVMFFFTAELPMWFKYLGGIGDIAAGIGAFLAHQALRKGKINERQAIIRGNAAGILDFILVLGFGAGVVLQHQSADIMFNLIPLYVVPLFILLHIFSLQRLAVLPSSRY
ncbi:hypothetical protein [Paraglaciecola sp.]|uniref:hypothetical protein n=1 Tax=Paraglaciecola sp. TaxID=1920173 RepID=UPI003EF6C396